MINLSKRCEAWLVYIGHVTFSLRTPYWRHMAYHIEHVGYGALGIVAMLSFLIGVVLMDQLGSELQSYGATLYATDLLSVSLVREFAPFMTAIIMAGRTAASYSAQLATMKQQQTIDYLITMGLDPFVCCIGPRLWAMLIAMPLLTVLSLWFGWLGGWCMGMVKFNLSGIECIKHFKEAMHLSDILYGCGKIIPYALGIGMIGCYKGLHAKVSIDGLGRAIMESVVNSMVWIIVMDAGYATFFWNS
jgi:phospholipid/cholesterol/gamma-HCH transport system permease protein